MCDPQRPLSGFDAFLANRVPLPEDQTAREEFLNAATHGIGAALASAAAALLVLYASLHGDTWRVVSLGIYGVSMVLLYLASTLYHAISNPRLKRFFRLADHVSIYLLIAGTYTPITLVLMRGNWGFTLFGLIWGLALCGILAKIFLMHRVEWLSVVFYIGMGWLVLVALQPLRAMLPPGLLLLLGLGGLSYTAGVVFYACKRIPFHHAIWHLFVLGGSALHFAGMLIYVTRAPA